MDVTLKRKQPSDDAAKEVIDVETVEADLIPLLTPSKRYATTASRRVKTEASSNASSPTSPLVIARTPSDSSKLWAARIAATQRIAQRRRSNGGGGSSSAPAAKSPSRTSAAMAKRRALSLSPAAASFEASVSITTSLVEPKKTPVKTPLKRRRASTSTSCSPVVEEEEQEKDVKMKDQEDKKTILHETNETPTNEVTPPRTRRRSSRMSRTPTPVVEIEEEQENDVEMTEEKVSQDHDTEYEPPEDEKDAKRLDPEDHNTAYAPPEEEAMDHESNNAKEETATIECKVEIKTEPEIIVKVERRSVERPPLAPSPSRRRTLFATTESTAAEAAVEPQHETGQSDTKDVDELTERLAALSASLAAEQAEKEALKQQLEVMAQRLRESEAKQQQLESQVASLSAAMVTVKEEQT